MICEIKKIHCLKDFIGKLKVTNPNINTMLLKIEEHVSSLRFDEKPDY